MAIMNTAPGTELRRADGQKVRVLVVDDESTLTELLSMALRLEGWEIRSAADGFGAVQAARSFPPDTVVLDMMLPDMDGLEVLRRLRAQAQDVPVLFLTAKDAVEDRIAGLTAGGDDYVTKPFSLEEVVLRIRAILRRTRGGSGAPQDEVARFADLELNDATHVVRRAGRVVDLTP